MVGKQAFIEPQPEAEAPATVRVVAGNEVKRAGSWERAENTEVATKQGWIVTAAGRTAAAAL